MAARAEPSSPSIRALQRAVRRGRASAETRFWARRGRSGTPLAEPIPRDRSHSWLTYLWRGGPGVNSVSLVCPQAGFGNLHGLERVPRTQVWFRTYKTRNDCFGSYKFLLNPPRVNPSDLLEFLRLLPASQLDPLNPVSFEIPKDSEFPKHPLHGARFSAVQLPKAPRHREVEERPKVPRGTLTQYRVKSRILKNTRRVWVYRPPGEDRFPPRAPLVIFFDGYVYVTAIPTPTILDNLTRARKIPPTVAMFVDGLDIETRQRELPGYAPFGRFLVRELLPWVRRTLGYFPSANKTALAGLSYGGLAALYWASRYPGSFQRVLSQSGSFWWSPPGTDEPEALTRDFMKSPKLPLKIYMDAGRYEAGSDPENEVGLLAANRHLRDVLRLRGYSPRYREFCGGHDFYCWRQTVVDGLRGVLAEL
jgi:enterochelin esterase-like enzyme